MLNSSTDLLNGKQNVPSEDKYTVEIILLVAYSVLEKRQLDNIESREEAPTLTILDNLDLFSPKSLESSHTDNAISAPDWELSLLYSSTFVDFPPPPRADPLLTFILLRRKIAVKLINHEIRTTTFVYGQIDWDIRCTFTKEVICVGLFDTELNINRLRSALAILDLNAAQQGKKSRIIGFLTNGSNYVFGRIKTMLEGKHFLRSPEQSIVEDKDSLLTLFTKITANEVLSKELDSPHREATSSARAERPSRLKTTAFYPYHDEFGFDDPETDNLNQKVSLHPLFPFWDSEDRDCYF